MLTTKKPKYSSLYAPDGMTNDNMSGYRSTMRGLNDTYGGDILGYQNTDAFKGLDSSSQNNYYNDRTYFTNLYGNVSAYDSEWNLNQANLKREQEYANTRKMLMQRYMPETLARMGYANTGAAGDAMMKLNNTYDNYAMNSQNNALDNEKTLFSQYNNVLQTVENEKIAEEQALIKEINDTKQYIAKNGDNYTDAQIEADGYKAGLTPQQIQELKDYRDSLSGVGTKGSGYNADVSINTQAKAFTPKNSAGYILQNMGQSVSTAGKNRQRKFIEDILKASANGQIKDGTLIDFNYGLSSSQNQAGTVYIWDKKTGQWIQTNLSRKQAEDMFPEDFYTGDLFGAKGWNWNKLNPFDNEGQSFYTDYDYNAATEEMPEEEAVEATAFNMENPAVATAFNMGDENVATNATTSGKKLNGKTGSKAYANKGGDIVEDADVESDPLADLKARIDANPSVYDDAYIRALVTGKGLTYEQEEELRQHRNTAQGLEYINRVYTKTNAENINPTDTASTAKSKLGVKVGLGGTQDEFIEMVLKASNNFDDGDLVDFDYGIVMDKDKAGSIYMWDKKNKVWRQTTMTRNEAEKRDNFYHGDLLGSLGLIGEDEDAYITKGKSAYSKWRTYNNAPQPIDMKKDNIFADAVIEKLGQDVLTFGGGQYNFINDIIQRSKRKDFKDGTLIDFNYGLSANPNKAGTIYVWSEDDETWYPTEFSRNQASKLPNFYTASFQGSLGIPRWLENIRGGNPFKEDSMKGNSYNSLTKKLDSFKRRKNAADSIVELYRKVFGKK